ncbi:hypothetical protein LLH06_16330 [Mucilaginibacter daejeonensis]|uniref:hypothetical protein n=1 Tax=Mucilaginibacter daejeonensis TaxID=398049 RepID=UPI001D174B2E|nr:hypothetical protein [Mucilaginibacter daejeonensis]UEG52526.1 hypothetical protein LLH06_16330 [Mucilaginibacter daejeonensis]
MHFCKVMQLTQYLQIRPWYWWSKQRTLGKAPVTVGITAFSIMIMAGICRPDAEDSFTKIKGSAGSPRFNLQFTNNDGSDVDLYVQTPNGSVINYQNISAQNGKMDVDCLCGDCPEGGNENVYWVPGTAPKGTFKVWARYFDPCVGENGSARYKLRIMDGNKVVREMEGSLSSYDRRSPVIIYER